jgi:hypothetical protein
VTQGHPAAAVKSFQEPDSTTTFLDGSVRVAVELQGTVVVGVLSG